MNDYKAKLHMDKIANKFGRKYPIPFYDYNWMYLRIMRKVEYLQKKTDVVSKFRYILNIFRLRQLSVKLGITIPPGTFDGGLTLYHWGSIVVNSNVKGGRFVTIQSDVNISKDVVIGDSVYIAPGVKILEGVKIAEGVMIGANSVVTKDILESYTTWVGSPAKKIKDEGYVNRVEEFNWF